MYNRKSYVERTGFRRKPHFVEIDDKNCTSLQHCTACQHGTTDVSWQQNVIADCANMTCTINAGPQGGLSKTSTWSRLNLQKIYEFIPTLSRGRMDITPSRVFYPAVHLLRRCLFWPIPPTHPHRRQAQLFNVASKRRYHWLCRHFNSASCTVYSVSCSPPHTATVAAIPLLPWAFARRGFTNICEGYS